MTVKSRGISGVLHSFSHSNLEKKELIDVYTGCVDEIAVIQFRIKLTDNPGYRGKIFAYDVNTEAKKLAQEYNIEIVIDREKAKELYQNSLPQ